MKHVLIVRNSATVERKFGDFVWFGPNLCFFEHFLQTVISPAEAWCTGDYHRALLIRYASF